MSIYQVWFEYIKCDILLRAPAESTSQQSYQFIQKKTKKPFLILTVRTMQSTVRMQSTCRVIGVQGKILANGL